MHVRVAAAATVLALVVACSQAAGCGGGGGGGGAAPPANNNNNNSNNPPPPPPPPPPPAPNANLTFLVPPTTVPVGARQLLPIFVAVQDLTTNATITSDTRTISLTIASLTPAGATIVGTTSQAAVNGVASFPDIAFTATGSLTLRAQASRANAAVSFPFTVGGIPANDGLGHVDDNGSMSFERSLADDRPDDYGLDSPADVAIDTVLQQAWIADTNNNRVVMYALGGGNDLSGVMLNVDRVLGQPDFRSRADGPPTAASLSEPEGVACDPAGSRVFVADTGNHRVLVFDVGGFNPPNGMDASHVLGQSGFATSSAGCTATLMNRPTALAYDATADRLFVADTGNRRVLVFDVSAISDGEPAVNVLGATDFMTTGAAAASADAVGEVHGLAVLPGGGRLFVADRTNHRVLVFDLSVGISDGMSAAGVLGQPDLTTGSATFPPTASSLTGPARLWHDSTGRLFVADQQSSRVLAFDTATISDGEDAVSVLGHSDFAGSVASVTSAGALTSPAGLAGGGDRLWVVDDQDHRALVFDVSTITDGEDAIQGVGHVDNNDMIFTRSNANDAPHPDAFGSVAALAMDELGHRLFVADVVWHRVLAFDLSLAYDFTGVDREADLVLGQPDLKSGSSGELDFPAGLAIDGTWLFVADATRHRVLVYELMTLATGAPPTHVLGQPDLTSTSSGSAADQMSIPLGLEVDLATQRLFVADSQNNRVLVFDVSSISDGEPAVAILGQPGAGSSTQATTQDGMWHPNGVAVDAAGGRIFVSDQGNHRILVFDTTALADGQPATNVLGQQDFVSGAAGSGAAGLSNPGQPEFDRNSQRLYVTDISNQRCLIFDAATVTDGEPAVSVLGQESMVSSAAAAGGTGMFSPGDVALNPGRGRVWVADGGNSRVLRFDLP